MFRHSNNQRSRAGAIILAFAFCFIAQYLFTGEIFAHFLDSNTWEWKPTFTFGLLFLFLAMVCAIWAFLPIPPSREGTDIYSHSGSDTINWTWTKYALICYSISCLLCLLSGENIIVQGLWLAGIGFLVIPLWRNTRAIPSGDTIARWEWGLVILITLIGFGLRYWNLLAIPSHVDNDIAFIGTTSLKLIQSGNYNWIGSSDSGGLLAYDQLISWSMRLFGQNQYGVVMISVIFGTLSLPLTFLLGKEMGGKKVGLIAMALLTINYTHIQFSRILFGPSATLFTVLAAYFLLRGWHSKHPAWFALSGVSIGLGLLTYESSRILPVIIVILIVWQWLWHPLDFRATIKNWLILILGALIAFGPYLVYALQNLSRFNGRGNDVMLWNPQIWQHEMDAYHTTSAIQVIWEQIWRTFLTLHLTGDSSPQFAFQRPMVSPLTAALVVLGLAYCIPRLKNLKYFLLILWVGITFIFGGVLTYDPPFWPHLNITLPAIVLLAALGADKLTYLLEPLFRRHGKTIVNSVLTMAIISTGFLNWDAYYNYVKDNAGPRVRMSRYLASLHPGYQVYLIDSEHNWNDFIFQFFNRGTSGENMDPETLTKLPPDIKQPTVFILYQHPELWPILQHLYPYGLTVTHDNNENNLVFISFEIVPPGISLQPKTPPVNELSLTGWWIIIGLLTIRIGSLSIKLWRQYQTISPS
jgi:4-amino-4-deoxy-L-arabinose transferase-like glycosyltransferase